MKIKNVSFAFATVKGEDLLLSRLYRNFGIRWNTSNAFKLPLGTFRLVSNKDANKIRVTQLDLKIIMIFENFQCLVLEFSRLVFSKIW